MPRYSPILTDGIQSRKLSEWRKYAKNKGYVFEQSASAGYRILDLSCLQAKEVKKLWKLKKK